MKFSFTTVSSLIVLGLTSSTAFAAPVAAPEPARAAGGGGRGSGAAKAVGSTVLGATVGTAFSSLLTCIENNPKHKSRCFGLKARGLDLEGDETEATEEDEEEDDHLSELVARGNAGAAGGRTSGARVSSAGKAVGTTVGTTVLGTLVSTTLAPIFKCLESGAGKAKCFGFHKGHKRGEETTEATATPSVAEDELHPDTVDFLLYLQTLAEVDRAAGSTTESAGAIAARSPRVSGGGFKSAAKAVGGTAGSAAGGALISNLTNCFLHSSFKKCVKSIF